jgi:hypothetical protein
MASINITYTRSLLNPTVGYVPYNDGSTSFADSVLQYSGGRLVTISSGVTKGLQFDFGTNIYTFGDTNYMQIGTGVPNKAFNLVGTGITAATAGTAAGQPHLIVSVNGIPYKIQLLAFS